MSAHRPHPGRRARERATLHKHLSAILALLRQGEIEEGIACLKAAVDALAPKAGKEAAE